jgi:hypothetical protein
MLHIVNGDSVGNTLKQGTLSGDILVWREMYSEGPVFPASAERSRREERAAYLEKAMGIPHRVYIENCEEQEKRLAGFRDYDDVVLWFEHDLFDHTMLCYLLDWFSRQKMGQTRLHLLCIGSFPGKPNFRGLGELSVRELESLAGTWQPVDREALELGSRAWAAYTSADPSGLEGLLRQDTSALPFLKEAFGFHLKRYPSRGSGLGIMERFTLELLQQGEQLPLELFRRAGDFAGVFGMGDLQFWAMLRRLSKGPHTLIGWEGSAPVPSLLEDSGEFLKAEVRLTDLGREVLQGRLDWLSAGGMNGEWLGGVCFTGTPAWRWNADLNGLVLE